MRIVFSRQVLIFIYVSGINRESDVWVSKKYIFMKIYEIYLMLYAFDNQVLALQWFIRKSGIIQLCSHSSIYLIFDYSKNCNVLWN